MVVPSPPRGSGPTAASTRLGVDDIAQRMTDQRVMKAVLTVLPRLRVCAEALGQLRDGFVQA